MSGHYKQSDSDQNDQKGHYLTPFQRKLLQTSLQDDVTEQYRQRIQIMLLADEGKTKSQICEALGCSPGTARHWILMAKAGLAHNWHDSPLGRPKAVNDLYLERLKELVSQSPKEFGYAFQLWTAQWLSKHLTKEFGFEISPRHINRMLKDMGLSTRSNPASLETTNETTTNHGRVEVTKPNLEN